MGILPVKYLLALYTFDKCCVPSSVVLPLQVLRNAFIIGRKQLNYVYGVVFSC